MIRIYRTLRSSRSKSDPFLPAEIKADCFAKTSLICLLKQSPHLGLLPAESHLSGHNALPFGYESAFGASTITPATVAFVSFKGRDHSVVTTPGALGRPLVALGCTEEHGGRGRCRRRRNPSVMVMMMSGVVLTVMLLVMAVVLMRWTHVSSKSGKEAMRAHHAISSWSGTGCATCSASVSTGDLMAAVPMRWQIHLTLPFTIDRQFHY